uniref:CSON013889 protein n=1 Tax=Culicoides sonorensis TaxID=179676 RepID=A0A336MDC2_CULSO
MKLRECAPCFSDPLFLGEYIDDIVRYLYEREKSRIPFNNNSPQIEYRNLLVDFIQKIAEHRGFRRTTLFLGVYLLDIFMDNHSIALERLNIVSIVCLILAAKVEEMECTIPKLSEIKQLTNTECTVGDYISLEALVLNFFNNHIIHPTVATFLEIYIDAIISEDDYKYYNTHVSETTFKDFKSMKIAVTKTLFEFSNITLSCKSMSHERPSYVAASIVCATRQAYSLEPIWNTNILYMTGYRYTDLDELILRLLKYKKGENDEVNDKRKSTPESGYISFNDSTSSDDDEIEDEEDMGDVAKRLKTE